MSEMIRPRVLVTGTDPGRFFGLSGPLLEQGLECHFQLWNGELEDTLRTTRFDVMVVQLPVDGPPLATLFSALRSGRHPCRYAAVLLLGRRPHLANARHLIGSVATRALPDDSPLQRVVGAIVQLARPAPRVRVKVPTRIRTQLPTRPVAALCQTLDLSATGMLLHGSNRFAVGTWLQFELELPGQDLPVRGTARVSRHADPQREGVNGFGAVFVAFDADSGTRLDTYLSSRVS
jgi:hypothetical protein